MRYRRLHHWKYELLDHYKIYVGVMGEDYDGDFLSFHSGELTLRPGYCWDGATGAPDFKATMVPCLVHDALYQLLRMGVLAPTKRDDADDLFYRMLKRRKFPLAVVYYRLVRIFGSAKLGKGDIVDERVVDVE